MRKTKQFQIIFFSVLLMLFLFAGQSILSEIEAEGAPQDNEYLTSLRKKALQGDTEAQCELGDIYTQGHGVPQNYLEGMKWFLRAAKQGNANAQNNIGFMHFEGYGVPQNYKEGIKWFRKAAEKGQIEAQFNLGLIYDKGEGVPQNYLEAAKWYRKAAEKGHVDAQISFAFKLGLGQGVSQNIKFAYVWFSIAAANSMGETHKKAVRNRDLVANSLTTGQLNEAQQIASEWKPKTGNKE